MDEKERLEGEIRAARADMELNLHRLDSRARSPGRLTVLLLAAATAVALLIILNRS